MGNQERLDKDRSCENFVVNMNLGNQEMLAEAQEVTAEYNLVLH